MARVLFASTSRLGMAAVFGYACSSRSPVWPKDPRSDTPLLQFVVGADKNVKAGYIDAKGHIVVPPTFVEDGDYDYNDSSMGLLWSRSPPNIGTSTQKARGCSVPAT